MNKAEFEKHILDKSEPGKLYLKLREEFNTFHMEMHHTMACISRDAVKVIKTDSKGEVSSTDMILSSQEFAVLAEGFRQVQYFWNEQPLHSRQVLLGCGCIVDWDAEWGEYDVFEGKRIHKDLPSKGEWTYCTDHEEARIYRFNVDDFTDVFKNIREDQPD